MSHVSSPSCVTGRKQVAPPPLAPPPLTVRYRRLQGRFIWVRPKTSAAALGREIPQQHSSQGFQVGGGVVRAARPLRLLLSPPADRVTPHHRISRRDRFRRSVRLWASPVRGTGTSQCRSALRDHQNASMEDRP